MDKKRSLLLDLTNFWRNTQMDLQYSKKSYKMRTMLVPQKLDFCMMKEPTRML